VHPARDLICAITSDIGIAGTYFGSKHPDFGSESLGSEHAAPVLSTAAGRCRRRPGATAVAAGAETAAAVTL
jgi:hypothetical protein